MDNFENSNSTPDNSLKPEENQQEELNFTDKMVGVLAEPTVTFEKISKSAPKTIDWFLPMLLLLVVVFISQLLLQSNKEIYFQIKQKQMERIEKNLNEMVKEGKMTQDQMNTQMNAIQERMDQAISPVYKILQGVGILIVGFIILFIMTGIYFLFAKVLFKGEGTYQSALVANGLVSYIVIIQVIVTTIVAFTMNKMMSDLSIASFMDIDKSTIGGFLLAKLDIFSLWSYSILSIGLAKMFKSSSVLKYFLLVFGVWIVGGLLLFFLAKAIPFLRILGM